MAKVWDLRCGARALATLDEHFAVVNRVAWSPTHTEILATGSFDRQFKLWSLNLPPHYVIATKRATAPVAGAGFLKRMRFHACGVMQDGSVVVAKLSDQFVEPLVPRLDGELGGDVGGRGEVPPEREVARMIYLRDFAVAFERALAVAEKLSLQQQYAALSFFILSYSFCCFCSLSFYLSFIQTRDGTLSAGSCISKVNTKLRSKRASRHPANRSTQQLSKRTEKLLVSSSSFLLVLCLLAVSLM